MKSCSNIMKKVFRFIPQRYVLGIMGFLAITNAYQMRVCLSVAITEMVVHKPISGNSSHPKPGVCAASPGGNDPTDDPPAQGQFEWSEETQGIILSSFYWGYLITHLPGGLLADKFGGKYTLGIGILTTAIFTFVIPLVADSGVGWFIASRVITGLGEGTTYPALNDLLARWIPLEERSLLGSFVYAGGQIGTVTGTLISGVLLSHYKGQWELVFYVFGALGVLWFIFWVILCYSDPSDHPFITDKEKDYLIKTIGDRSQQGPPIPWRYILSSVPVWGLVAAQIGHDWGFYTMVTDLPKYMSDVLFFNIGANGVLSSIPYIVMWLVSIAAGWLCDVIIRKRWLTVTASRKLFTTIAHIGPSVFLIAASYAGCNRTLTVVFFTISMGFMGTFYPGMKVNGMDLSPNFAGTIMAISNGLGALTGIITPYLIGVLTPNHLLMEWRTVFWITVAVNLVTLVMFLTMASGDVQFWNDPANLPQNISDSEKSEVTFDDIPDTRQSFKKLEEK